MRVAPDVQLEFPQLRRVRDCLVCSSIALRRIARRHGDAAEGEGSLKKRRVGVGHMHIEWHRLPSSVRPRQHPWKADLTRVEASEKGSAPELRVPHTKIGQECHHGEREQEGFQLEVLNLEVAAFRVHTEGALEALGRNAPPAVVTRRNLTLAGDNPQSRERPIEIGHRCCPLDGRRGVPHSHVAIGDAAQPLFLGRRQEHARG